MPPKSRRPALIFGSIVLILIGIGLNIALPSILGKSGSLGNGSSVRVVATSVQVQQGDQLSAANLTTVAMDSTQVPPGAVTDIAALNGQFVLVSLPGFVPLVPSLVTSDAKLAHTVAVSAPLDVKPGNVSFAVPFDPLVDSGGYIRANDHIDAIVYQNGQIAFTFQDIHVLRIGTPQQQDNLTSPTVMVLELSRAQALQLGAILDPSQPVPLGTSAAHVIRFVLRAASEYGKGPLPG